MSCPRRALRRAAAGALAALALGACTGGDGSSQPGSGLASGSSGFNAAITSIVNPSDRTGGTLRLGAVGDCDSYDGANMYLGFCWDLSRLYLRTLMTYHAKPGPIETVPDLASAPGQHNADSTIWTYHLKPGVRWQDGTPVTSADVKYGIERLYATDVFATGAGFYYTCLLDTCDAAGTPTYKGPYRDPTGDLSTIETPDATTVVFHLNAATPSFDYLMSLPTTAPVKRSADTGKSYTDHVLADGPFKFASYLPDKSVTWVRNDQWDPKTDDVRHPKVDSVTMTIFASPDDVDARLKAGDIDLEADGGVQATFETQILADPKLRNYADNPTTGHTRILVVFQTVAPLTNVYCRRAIFYAINKHDLQLARGGTSAGTIATSFGPPGIPGSQKPQDYDPYPVGGTSTGDVAKAKTELTKCGQPDGFALNMAYIPGGAADKVLAATQAALARVNITVKPLPGEASSYYSTLIGSPTSVAERRIGLAVAAWGPDFPTVQGEYQSIASGKAIKASGTLNFASLNDPTVNAAIDRAAQTTDPKELEQLGETIDHGIMDAAVYLPFLWDSNFLFRNPRLTNIYLSPGTSFFYDYVNIGVVDGK